MDGIAAVLIAGLALARSSETGQRIIRVQMAENIYIPGRDGCGNSSESDGGDDSELGEHFV